MFFFVNLFLSLLRSEISESLLWIHTFLLFIRSAFQEQSNKLLCLHLTHSEQFEWSDLSIQRKIVEILGFQERKDFYMEIKNIVQMFEVFQTRVVHLYKELHKLY